MKLQLGAALTIGGFILPHEPNWIYALSLVFIAAGGLMIGSWAAERKW